MQEHLNSGKQLWQVPIHDAPDSRIINRVVAVDDTIAEGNDARQLTDMTGRIGIEAREAVERLANDFKLPFDGPPELAVRFVLGESPMSAPATNAPTGFQDINQQFLRVVVHR